MNRHLNIFHTYTKVNREQQLENDLTRALAICLQEDTLFLHSVLRAILDQQSYDSLFMDSSGESKISIEIQKNVETLVAFNKLYAVSITGLELSPGRFFNQKQAENKDHITDLVILANDIAIIVEIKPGNSDCTWQLAQQAYKAIESAQINFADVVPVDLNWKKLMAIAVQVSNFNKASGNNSRFLNDFIQFIRGHNHTWLPVAQFSSLMNSMTKVKAYRQRLNAVLLSMADQHEVLDYNDRMGLKLNLGWAQEILVNFEKYKDSEAALLFGFWPGNTKGQGTRMFAKIGKKEWTPPSSIELLGHSFRVKWGYELKFCHFNGYVSNLVISDSQVKTGKHILSRQTHNRTGKYERHRWDKLEKFLDDYLVADFNWRKSLGWNKNFVNTNRSYLTLSIGYQIETVVPVSFLQQIDTSQSDFANLTALFIEIKNKYRQLFDE